MSARFSGRGNTRRLSTPEGVELTLDVASVPLRLVAFVVDMVIVMILTIILLIGGAIAADGPMGDSWAMALAIFGTFLLRNFYFVWFEARSRGQTPGKRLAGVRVVDAYGRPLGANAVFLRNITRDMELFLPLVAVFAPQAIWPEAPWWAGFLFLGWLLVIGALPFLNRNNLRVGDLVAGTIVVQTPRSDLLDDVSTKSTHRLSDELSFANEQLDMYGIYELQVLEKVLRGAHDSDTLEAVAARVSRKIGYAGLEWKINARAFLDAFYRALRARLEHRMILGDRQEQKKQGRLDAERPTRPRPPSDAE